MKYIIFAILSAFTSFNLSCVSIKSDRELEQQIKAEKDRYYSNFTVKKKY